MRQFKLNETVFLGKKSNKNSCHKNANKHLISFFQVKSADIMSHFRGVSCS